MLARTTTLKAGLQLIGGVALTAVCSASFAAPLFPPFLVDESVSGLTSGGTTVEATRITGQYNEVITLDGAAGTFEASIRWNAGQLVFDDDTTGSTFQNINGYGLYALYQASGTFVTSGTETTFTTTPGVGSLEAYLDPDEDTAFTTPTDGTTFYGTSSDSDDLRVATGTPLAGSGTLDPANCNAGINCGSFGTSASFDLTNPDGQNYFTLPDPFYQLSFQSGQFNTFSVPTGTEELTQSTTGSLDLVFARVPEPASLALLGLGLLGMGAVRRSRRG